jgi:GNAT superfamily N-acetyltransferase
VSPAGSVLLAPAGEAYQAAKLRWATLADCERLRALFSEARPDEQESAETMADWLEHGGAALLEDARGVPLCAVRWRESKGSGWRIDRVATLPEARNLGFGRWLMTKVEALAIRYNIPSLSVTLADPGELGYYRRLGYVPEGNDGSGRALIVGKRVGGVWQLRESQGR